MKKESIKEEYKLIRIRIGASLGVLLALAFAIITPTCATMPSDCGTVCQNTAQATDKPETIPAERLSVTSMKVAARMFQGPEDYVSGTDMRQYDDEGSNIKTAAA